MRIVKVKNKKMFKSKNPEGIHYYAFWWNKKHKQYNAVRLTHIAKKDSVRYEQVEKGQILNIRLKSLDKYADSGITRDNYITDVYGNKLNPSIGQTIIKNVSSSVADKIKKNIKYTMIKGKSIKR